MDYKEELMLARLELKAMRDRHKREAEPLKAKINRLAVRTIRQPVKDENKEQAFKEACARGEIRSDDPEHQSWGALPITDPVIRNELCGGCHIDPCACGDEPDELP